MALLILGILLFCAVHLIPSLAPTVKASWLSKMGEGGYKGSYSLLLLASFALMVIGWRSTPPSLIYPPEYGLRSPAMLLITIAFLLMVVASRSSRLTQWIRHPQLTGVLLWAVAHLLLNGDNRSMVLFSSLAVWAVLEMVSISRREGAWVKKDIPSWGSEALTVAISIAVVIGVALAHPYITGVAII